ncbi:MAG: sodium:solute symporter [Gemmatimonadetes bacterium]|nr:sodium:solute symporter [Gemmatimonadota bacterium]
MTHFSALDWFWTAAFLVLMIGGPFVFYRLARRTESDFFLAGRGLPWWLPASSVFSTHTATDTPMWVTGVIYPHGLRGLWYTFFAAWTAVGSLVSARIFRRSLAYTQAEWQELRFAGLGSELLRGWLAGWGVFMNMFILGWVSMAMGKVGTLAFGWPFWAGLLIPTLITAVYTLAAGYWGVVMGDFLQGIVAAFAIVVVSLIAVYAVGGPSQLSVRLVTMGEGWRLNPLAFTGWFGGSFPIAWWITMLVIAVIGGFGMGTSIDWYAEAQRIQSAGTVRDATYGIWAGGMVTLVRNSFWAAAALAFFSMVPGLTTAGEYEVGWFRIGFELLPVGMLGIFFAAILAIHFSTISSHLNLGALYATRDLYQRYLKPKAGQAELVWVGRVATVVLLVGAFFYGLTMKEVTQWLIFALWLMMAGIWLPNILQVVWWRFNAWGYLLSWITNLGLSWLVVWVLPAFKLIPPLPDYLQFWLLMALGAAILIPVTLLTRPEPMDRLVKYYAMTRPLGWWGPVRREAERRGMIGLGRRSDSQTDRRSATESTVRPSDRPTASAAEPRRPLIQRAWTAEQAEEWTREDWIAIVLSPVIFALMMIGLARLLLAQWDGGWMVLLAVLGTVVVYWVIDPKLRAVSQSYESRQAGYLQDLERQLRSAGAPAEGT